MTKEIKYNVEQANRARRMTLVELWKNHKCPHQPTTHYHRWSIRQYMLRRASWY